MEFKEKAEIMFGYFEKGTRNDGREFWKTKDNRPDWLDKIIRKAHGDMLPDDWKYEFIARAASDLCESDDPDEIYHAADSEYPYTSSRLNWIASHLDRPGYVDEIMEEYGAGAPRDIVELIGLGMMREMDEVFQIVKSELEDLDLDDDE